MWSIEDFTIKFIAIAILVFGVRSNYSLNYYIITIYGLNILISNPNLGNGYVNCRIVKLLLVCSTPLLLLGFFSAVLTREFGRYEYLNILLITLQLPYLGVNLYSLSQSEERLLKVQNRSDRKSKTVWIALGQLAPAISMILLIKYAASSSFDYDEFALVERGLAIGGTLSYFLVRLSNENKFFATTRNIQIILFFAMLLISIDMTNQSRAIGLLGAGLSGFALSSVTVLYNRSFNERLVSIVNAAALLLVCVTTSLPNIVFAPTLVIEIYILIQLLFFISTRSIVKKALI